MTTWDYRIIQEPEGDLAIREVFYDETNTIIGCTDTPIEPFGQTIDELRQCLADLQAALDRPILQLSDIPEPEPTPTKLSPDALSADDIRQQLGLDRVTSES
ncbi:MAG: hypothetical protein EAZ61_07375 [Oscillatoriales cyanobacterium]|jgi:hypothetical protein|nr:MAG: hypothetical protein EAZ61_07375 [Oscillatoriales cyanobacterium]